jgi:hypothetical protein
VVLAGALGAADPRGGFGPADLRSTFGITDPGGASGTADPSGTFNAGDPSGTVDPVAAVAARGGCRATSAWPLVAGALAITVLIGAVLAGAVLQLIGTGRSNTGRDPAPAVISGCSLVMGACRAKVTGMAEAGTADSRGARWSATGCRAALGNRGWADPDCAVPEFSNSVSADSGPVALRGFDAIASRSTP